MPATDRKQTFCAVRQPTSRASRASETSTRTRLKHARNAKEATFIVGQGKSPLRNPACEETSPETGRKVAGTTSAKMPVEAETTPVYQCLAQIQNRTNSSSTKPATFWNKSTEMPWYLTIGRQRKHYVVYQVQRRKRYQSDVDRTEVRIRRRRGNAQQ